MDIGSLPILSAVWFGVLTSITPCPLATNIAATTYIGKQINTGYGTVLAGISYTLGRTTAYIIISMLILSGIFSIPGISRFLQAHMNQILGPVLICAGIFILDIIPLRLPSIDMNSKLSKKFSEGGILGAFFLGNLFALSFCPVSAALFFGSVIPLSMKYQSTARLPFCYGVGTAAPVIAFAFLIAYGSRFAGRVFNQLTAVESWLRRATGALFIFVGLYFCLKYIFKIINF